MVNHVKLLYFPPIFLLMGNLLSVLIQGAVFVFSVWLWSEAKAEQGRHLLVLIVFFFHPQIEKIMTLIGAGIDFSRDQQYATPGTVPFLVNGDGTELI